MDKRKLASNFILFSFFILVALATLFSELFQKPIKTASEAIEQTKLFTGTDLGLIKRIALKNKSGEFIFERKELAPGAFWKMVSPRETTSGSLFVEKLFNELEVIKIKKIYPDETLNNSNFALDKPGATVTLSDETGKAINIQVGLMNSIDTSTYLKVSGKTGIFHVEAPSVSLENATLADLIESQIIAVDLRTISGVKIFHNKKIILEIKKKGIEWFDSEGFRLSSRKTEDYLAELASLKSSYVLDKQTDAQKRQISNLLKTAEYSLILEVESGGEAQEFTISGSIKSLSDLDLKNEESCIITAGNDQTAYVVKKEIVEMLNRKPETFKETVVTN